MNRDQIWIDNYNEIILKYNKNNGGKLPHDFLYKNNQEQLADDLFDRFYEQAKLYAQSVPDLDDLNEIYNDIQLETILSIKWFLNSLLNVEFIKSSNSTEDSVFRRFLEQFRKLIAILLTKNKFKRLLSCNIENKNNIIKSQINQSLIGFQSSLQRNTLSSNIKKGEVLNSIQSIVELINYYVKESGILNVQIVGQYFQINVIPIVLFSCSLENNQVYRVLSFSILETLPGTAFKQQTLKLLSQISNDQFSLDHFWMYGGINDNESIQILLSRIPSSSSIELARNILITISNALKSKYFEIRSGSTMEVLYINILFQFIDSFSKKKTHNPEAQDNESQIVQFEIIDLLSNMVKQSPDNPEILERVKSFGTNEESLSIILNNSNWFSKNTWINILLPFLRNRVEAMKLQGVSGIQSEQTVIDCIRECARLFYLNSLISISYEDSHQLGHNLLKTIVEAMRHGYFETERFPMICSIIILNHFPHSIEWFNDDLLNPQICNTLKNSRAIFEVFLRLLGFIDIEESTTLSETKSEHIHRIFHAIAQIRSHTSFALVSACLFYKSGKRFLIENPLYINLLIQSMKDVIIEALDNECYLSVNQSEAITECIKNLSLIVHPFDSPLLFNLSLQTLSMVPPQFASSFGDETLSRMVDKVSDGVPLCFSDIELGLKIGGPETRYSLCSFVPQLCLKDKDPYIRCQALRAMAKREDLICTHYSEIINSTKVQNGSAYDLELAISASPMMPIISSIERSLIPECLQIIYRAIRLSSISDPQNKPNPSSIGNLNEIMEDITLSDLLSYFKNSTLLSVVYKLKGHSLKLKGLLKELSKRGILQKNKKNQDYILMSKSEDGVNLNSPSSILLEQCKLHENNDILKSISILLKVKRDYNEFFVQSVKYQYLTEQFLPKILKLHFTEISTSNKTLIVSESLMNMVEKQQHIYRDLLNLFDDDLDQQRKSFEAILTKNKNIVILEYFLNLKKDPTSARKWMKDNFMRDQSLLITIEKYENNLLSSSLNSNYLDLENRSNNNIEPKYVIKPNLYDTSISILMKTNLSTNNPPMSPNLPQMEVEMKSLHLDDNQQNDEFEIYNPEREEKNWSKILSFQDKVNKNLEMKPLLSTSSTSKPNSKSTKKLVGAS